MYVYKQSSKVKCIFPSREGIFCSLHFFNTGTWSKTCCYSPLHLWGQTSALHHDKTDILPTCLSHKRPENMPNLLLTQLTNSPHFPHHKRNFSGWSHEENKGRSWSSKSNSVKHQEHIFSSVLGEQLLPVEAHFPQQTVEKLLPGLSPLHLSPALFSSLSVSIKRQVLRRADLSFSVDSKSASPWLHRGRKMSWQAVLSWQAKGVGFPFSCQVGMVVPMQYQVSYMVLESRSLTLNNSYSRNQQFTQKV